MKPYESLGVHFLGSHCSALCFSFVFACGLHGCASSNFAKMDCGENVELCGVLVLSSGFGRGLYRHRKPYVHGLWPETGRYGNSRCKLPTASASAPKNLYACYKHESETTIRLLGFETHEWSKHGMCAGLTSESEYFKQVCSLSAEPLKLMRNIKVGGGGITKMQGALAKAGYPVWKVHRGTGELLLSVCAVQGRWILSEVADFADTCGMSTAQQTPLPKPLVPQSVLKQACVVGKYGPACIGNNDCQAFNGCLRCAQSGFCTSEPLQVVSKAIVSKKCVLRQRGPACMSDDDCLIAHGCLRCANSGFCTGETRHTFLGKTRRRAQRN